MDDATITAFMIGYLAPLIAVFLYLLAGLALFLVLLVTVALLRLLAQPVLSRVRRQRS
jgi:hypothetical protein